MKNEKQIKELSKYLPKHIVLSSEQHDRELTADEFKITKGYFEFYGVHNWIKQRGMIIGHISKDSYLDFGFINTKDDNGKHCIYLNLK